MSFPSRLLLKGVIERLQAYNKDFNLYEHKSIKSKWVIGYNIEKVKSSDLAYPLTAPKGKNTYINIQRLKAIKNHFKIPEDIFTLTPKEIKNKYGKRC